MEFFAETDKTTINVKNLQTLLSIRNLPKLCNSIDKVLSDNITNGAIYCLWGEFDINREKLIDGIRFSLPDCPNAVAWTITFGKNNTLHIHCTIKQPTHEPDFIESIEEFTNDFKIGLNRELAI